MRGLNTSNSRLVIRSSHIGCLVSAVGPSGGGHLSVRVFHRWAQHENERDNLLVSVVGRGLDAPLIERLLELPFDIHSGTVDGELHVIANDDATWDFPAITGKLACKGVLLCLSASVYVVSALLATC